MGPGHGPTDALRDMITSQDIIKTAREYLGTPFHHQGRVKGVGVDCGGLAICVARDLGLPYVDVQGYSRTPSGGAFIRYLTASFDRVHVIEDGCILLMTFSKEPQHVAIYTGNDAIIHSYFGVRKVTEHRLDGVWHSRITAIFKFRGIE